MMVAIICAGVLLAWFVFALFVAWLNHRLHRARPVITFDDKP